MHSAFPMQQGGQGGPGMGFPRGPGGPFGFEKPFPVVRLRGLPFTATEYDIFEFFQARPAGLDFSGVGLDSLLSLEPGRRWAESIGAVEFITLPPALLLAGARPG